MYPIDKYRFFTQKTKNGIKTIAVSTYAGKTVRGTAICHPSDTYDEELGKRIAAAKCEVKISQKRLANAKLRLNGSFEMYFAAQQYRQRMMEYHEDSMTRLNEATFHLRNLLSQ